MDIFKPTFMVRRLSDIDADMLRKLNIRFLLLDVDNTLASYISHEPVEGAVAWVKEMQRQGFKLVIVSNNYKKRVEPFSKNFGLPFITFACKPLPFGYLKAKKLLKAPAEACAIIGDQIYTDIVGANLCGMKSVLLEPVEAERDPLFRLRRRQEKKLRDRYSQAEHK